MGQAGQVDPVVVAGLDEIALHDVTQAALWREGRLTLLTIEPEKLGLRRYELSELAGGDPAHNARMLQEVLAGRGTDAHNQAVALNTGALLWIAGRAADLQQGLKHALQTLQEGQAADTLRRLAEISHGA